jgi:hypothetical protein
MSRSIPALAVALLMVLTHAPLSAAPKKEKRAYKPAEKRQKAAEAEPSDTPDADKTLEEALQEAREKRDKDLEDAAANETDRKTLDKRKQEIFSQYAAIVAALRDKYNATHPDDPAVKPPASGKTAKAGRPKNVDPDPATDDETADAKGKKKGRKTEDALAAAQEKLDEENDRHRSKLEQLNAQLRQAETSGNQREVRKVQKAIEKENNSYEAKKTILERKVQDLGGTAPATVAPESDRGRSVR